MQQTKISRRFPAWFKEMMREWRQRMNDIYDPQAFFHTSIWACNCLEFRQSTFFLCGHLVRSSNRQPKFYDELKVAENHPFIKFNSDKSSNG